jgi:lipopolysaccharide export system protein LptA
MITRPFAAFAALAAPAALIMSGFFLLASPNAMAQKNLLQATGENAPEDAPPIQILSDSLVYDDEKKTSRFDGDVIMTRGLLTMRAHRLDLREDAEGFQFGTATVSEGKRVYIRQERPEFFEVLQGLGERAEYDGKEESFDLIGRAQLTRFICGKPFDSISGERVRYNQKTDTYSAFSGPRSDNPDGRVRSVAQPRAKIDAAIEVCRRLQSSGAPVPGVSAPPNVN